MRCHAPRFICLVVVTVAVILTTVGTHIAVPLYQRQTTIERFAGRLEIVDGTPPWLSRIAGDKPLHAFSRVIRASFNDKMLEDADIRLIGQLTELEDVSLEYTRIDDAGLAHLAGLQALRHLSLRTTPITDAGLAHLRELKSLESLSLRSTSVTDAGLEQLSDLPKLRTLYVGMTEITPDGLKRFRSKHPTIKAVW